MASETHSLLEGIQQFLDQQIRPALMEHAGDISITSLEDGVLRFRLTGGCSGCPSAWLTAEAIVKAPLTERFPELCDVVVDNDLDESMIQLARDVLFGKNQFT